MHAAAPRTEAPIEPYGWKTIAASIFIVAATIVTVLSNWTGTAPIVLGSLTGIVGGTLLIMSVSRTLRENAGQRIPHSGHPPVRPRRGDLLAGIGLTLVGLGPWAAFRASDASSGTLLFLALAVFLLLVSIVPNIVHNARVRRTASA